MRITPITTEHMLDAVGNRIPPLAPIEDNFPQFLERIGLGQTGSDAPSKPRVHTVERGQNLWQICKNCLASQGKNPTKADVHRAVMLVTKSNGLSDPDLLSIGQRLNLTGLYDGGNATKAPAIAIFARTKDDALVPVTPKTAPRTVNAPMAHMPRTMPAMPRRAQSFTMPEREPRLSMPEPSGAGKNGSAIGLPQVSSSRVPPLTPHPVQHARTHNTEPAAGTAAKQKFTDITGLIQSILKPGSMKEAGEAQNSPWSRVLGGPARLTSEYGMRKDPFTGRPQFHDGVDIAAKTGTQVFPSMPGKVVFSGWKPGYGRVVMVEHANGLETVYGHASKILVKAGDTVTADTPIAKVGSTGRSTGSHLHYEVRKNNVPVDPLPLLTGESLHVAQTL